MRRVEPLLLEPDFTYSMMKTKSAAAANLCNWVINIINFNKARYPQHQHQGSTAKSIPRPTRSCHHLQNRRFVKAPRGPPPQTHPADIQEGQATHGRSRVRPACESRCNGRSSQGESLSSKPSACCTRFHTFPGTLLLIMPFVHAKVFVTPTKT